MNTAGFKAGALPDVLLRYVSTFIGMSRPSVLLVLYNKLGDVYTVWYFTLSNKSLLCHFLIYLRKWNSLWITLSSRNELMSHFLASCNTQGCLGYLYTTEIYFVHRKQKFSIYAYQLMNTNIAYKLSACRWSNHPVFIFCFVLFCFVLNSLTFFIKQSQLH